MQPTLGGWCGVVTDATSTIGRAVALELGRDCVRVAIGYRGYRGADFEVAARIVREVVAAGGEAIPLRIPVDSLWELEQVIGSLAEHWGRLDFVVDLDNRCVFGRAALPWMLERAKGRIVHISSAGAAPISFTRQDSAQVAANGVAINTIHLAATCPAEQAAGSSSQRKPDTFSAGRQPDGGNSVDTLSHAAPPAKPEDVATTVYFLLAQSTCMTGQVIDLSGDRPIGCRRRRTPPTLARSTCGPRRRPARENFPRTM
jgi:NAD(P)-dependent dehydrogenase (short-subunit alcohol dehydrogenase family)